MKFSHRVIAGFALLSSTVCFAQSQTPEEVPCRQAVSISLAKPDVVTPAKPLLGLNNHSWMKEGSEYWDQCVPLLEFDLSSIPPKSQIASAVLKLTFYGRGQTEMRPVIRIHPITAAWDANLVTWNDKPAWDENSEIEVPSRPNDTWDPWEIDVTPLVQKWVDGGMENHGLAIVADSTNGDCHNFAFYDPTAGSGRAPVLKITFDQNAK
jgi:hypothetical protein